MATSNNDRISSQRLLDTLKGLQASRHLGSEPEVDPQTNEKTKHTIKQDYLPNADWSVNDPDADGYVEGRTHWVEVDEMEGAVNVQTGVQFGNVAMGVCDKFGAVKGFTYPTGEYNPGRTGEIGEFEEDGQTIAFSYIGEDENGNAIVPTNAEELMTALPITSIGIMLFKQEDNTAVYIAYPNATANDECTAIIVSENVHKLDRKFYDYTPRVDLTPYQKRIDLNNKDIDYNGIGTNFPFISTGEFAITTTNNVIHDLTVGNSNELLQFHHLWYEENLYSNKLKATALFWLIANCCTEIKDEQANVYTVNSIEKWSVNAYYHTAMLKTNDGEFTLEVEGSSCRFAPPSNVEGNTFTLTVDYYITGDMLSKGSLINSSLFNANNKVSLLANGVLMVRNNIRDEITIPKNTLGVHDTIIGTIVSNTVIDGNGDLWHAEGVYSETNLTIKFAKKQDNVWRYGIPDSPTVFMFAEITPMA